VILLFYCTETQLAGRRLNSFASALTLHEAFN